MRFQYTRHARVQMAFRRIADEEVEYALAHAYHFGPGNEDGTVVYDAVVGRRGIRVAVADGSDPLRIVSVMQRRIPSGLRQD